MLDLFSNQIRSKLDDIGKKKQLNEQDLKITLREIRLILVEADVNYQVAKNFCQDIEKKAIGSGVLTGLNAGEQITKIVKDEMLELLSGENQLIFEKQDIIMMVGLQGSGKTTTSGKLASFLRKKKTIKNPLLVALDVYRPAAIEQLITIAKQLAVGVYYQKETIDVMQIAKDAIVFAKENNHDLIIFDTAGRMHVDEDMMQEIKKIQEEYEPKETLLVIDGAIGQIAVDIANQFQNYVNLNGLIFTKMDSDTRGGAVFSVKKATDLEIKFLGTSEKMDGLESFDPKRVVSRILGQGDVLGLIEKAEEYADEIDDEDMSKKMMEGKFDLNDFLAQMKMMKKMGGLSSILKMLPQVKKLNEMNIDDKQLIKTQAIIESMTAIERSTPSILNAKRRMRIANGSGVRVQDVNKLIKGYEQSKKMMKQMKNMDMDQMMKMLK